MEVRSAAGLATPWDTVDIYAVHIIFGDMRDKH